MAYVYAPGQQLFTRLYVGFDVHHVLHLIVLTVDNDEDPTQDSGPIPSLNRSLTSFCFSRRGASRSCCRICMRQAGPVVTSAYLLLVWCDLWSHFAPPTGAGFLDRPGFGVACLLPKRF